jgi:hypothetical protein
MNELIQRYLAEIGRKGGQKSRRKLPSGTARDMVRVREAQRAYRKFHALCFWSYDPAYRVTLDDIPWVAEQLRKNGNRKTWELSRRLCP